MNNVEKSKFILDTLQFLFPNPQPSLNFNSAFTCLVAVMLSAQCTDKVTDKVATHLFSIADSPEKILDLGETKLKEIIHPCGFFNTKAKHILATSRILADDYHSCVPQDLDTLETLPGVGHKTASVVITHWFHRPAFPVDTHVIRLSHRWNISTSSSPAVIEKALKQLFPENTWSTVSLQMILYGRAYCPAKQHDITLCPICQKYNTALV